MVAHHERNKRALDARWHSLVSWSIAADKIEKYFEEVRSIGKELRWFESFYWDRNDRYRTVQLSYGVHPTGGAAIVNAEQGAALVFSQSVVGSVIVLFYPFESSLVTRDKALVTWNHFSRAQEITDKVILGALDDFLVYSRVTSACMVGSPRELRRVASLENRSRELEGLGGFRLGHSALLVLAVGSMITAFLLVRWIVLGGEVGQAIEPWVGLFTLLTGWSAAQVRRRDEAIERSRAKEEAERAVKNSELERSRKAKLAGDGSGKLQDTGKR